MIRLRTECTLEKWEQKTMRKTMWKRKSNYVDPSSAHFLRLCFFFRFVSFYCSWKRHQLASNYPHFAHYPFMTNKSKRFLWFIFFRPGSVAPAHTLRQTNWWRMQERARVEIYIELEIATFFSFAECVVAWSWFAFAHIFAVATLRFQKPQ